LFTVNGQAFPTNRMAAGRNQLLRVANMSANVSYLLQMTDDSAPSEPKTMDVITIDGLIAGTTPTGGSGLKVGVQLKSLLLMPAGRAEIFLPALPAGAGAVTLRTAGITTGPGGDPWPRIDLMHIQAPPALQTASRMRAASAPIAVGFPDIVLTRPLDPTMRNMAQSSAAAALSVPQNCIVLPRGQTVRRRITFANNEDGSKFLLGSEVVTPDGTPVDPARTTIAPQEFPAAAMAGPQTLPHVCPRYGEQEVWELVNTTGELHNFHIHQSKFRLAVPSDPGVPQGPLAIQDPTNIIASYVPEAQGATPNASVDVWHDTIPVPPASDKDHPGRVFVTIPFHARQQIGFFVFHCHILEHEDGGMMASMGQMRH
jgi:FtsP/CotA-like multicopper oxidase with cupredoxin domain